MIAKLTALALFLLVQGDVIQVQTRLVQVSVVVRDKNGPVGDLLMDDFTILDNKKPQRIDVFSVLDLRKDTKRGIVPLSPGAVSNRLSSDGETSQAVAVVLFDMLNTPAELQLTARQRLLDYVRTVQSGDRVALYLLGRELTVIQDFTGDPNVLVRAAARIRAQDLAGVELNSVVGVGVDVESLAALLDPNRGQTTSGSGAVGSGKMFANALSIYFSTNQANTTADAFESIARHLAGLPGRKNLVWMSAGFPFAPPQIRPAAGDTRTLYTEEPSNFRPQLDRASLALNNANVALYPVDVRGVNGVAYPQVMVHLAQATGGRAAYLTNDLQGAIRDAIADETVSYTLGFYSNASPSDKKLHDLVVKVNRTDVSVLHRPSYYPAETERPTAKQRQAALEETLASPIAASQIGLTAKAEPDLSTSGKYRLAVTVDIADIEFGQQKNRRTATLILAMGLESSKSARTETLSVSLTEEQYRILLTRGLVLNRVFSAAGGDRLRVAVQDRATGLTGSVLLPL